MNFKMFTVLLGCAAAAALVFAWLHSLSMIPSLKEIFSKQEPVAYSFFSDIRNARDKTRADSINQITHREPVYILDLNKYVAPQPDPSNYDEGFDNYSDSTIEAHYYSEELFESKFHYIEVRIKHPSQFRMALAFDTYGKEPRKYPSEMAAEVNAVAAIDGSFYNNRYYGVLMYKRKMYRYYPYNLDVLLIDSEGNFHIVKDKQLENSDVFEKYDIVNALSFGPELVRDGEALDLSKVVRWEPYSKEPRAAICQFDDDLHYLLCTVDGRMDESPGITTQQLADVLAQKGVRIAYNLDGGKSGTLILGNQVKNVVAYGGERKLGDILYFASALDGEANE